MRRMGRIGATGLPPCSVAPPLVSFGSGQRRTESPPSHFIGICCSIFFSGYRSWYPNRVASPLPPNVFVSKRTGAVRV